jgi:hypothetical protein
MRDLVCRLLAATAACAISAAGAIGATTPEQALYPVLPQQRAAPSLERQLALTTGSPVRAKRAITAMLPGATQGQALPPDWDTVTTNGFDLCGDGVIDDASEQCDGSDLGGATCESLGLGSGSLTCSKQGCRIYPDCHVATPVCSIVSCEVDADCEAGCGPCDHFADLPGFCRGTSSGGAL